MNINHELLKRLSKKQKYDIIANYNNLPSDIIRSIALYLPVPEITRFIRMNKKHYSSTYEDLVFVRKLASCRLSANEEHFCDDEYATDYSQTGSLIIVSLSKIVFADITRNQLAYAAYNGYEILVKKLVEMGDFDTTILPSGDYHKSDRNLHEALYSAAQRGHLDIVRYLVDNGANVHIKDGLPLLYEAVEHCRLDVVKYLLSKGARIFRLPEETWNGYDDVIIPAIEEEKHNKAIKYIVEYDLGFSETNDIPSSKRERYSWILYESLKYRMSDDLIKYLVNKGARLPNNENYCKYDIFCKCDSEMKEYLLSMNIIDQSFNLQPYITHLTPGENYFIFVNLRHPEYTKNIIKAASFRYFAIVEYLVKYHLKDVDKITKNLSVTYSHVLYFLALYDGPLELIKFLLDKGGEMPNPGIIATKFRFVKNDVADFLRERKIIPAENVREADYILDI